MKDKIIDFIRKNRITTTEVADCMNKSGAVSGVMPVNRGHFKVGNVKWVYAVDESNWTVHEQIVSVNENDIIFIDAINCGERAIIGELVCKYLLLYCQAAAVIINARVRDAAAIIRENYPVWCTGFSPLGCFNRKPDRIFSEDEVLKMKKDIDGSIAVCDDCGVVLIPKELHTEEFIDKLKAIEEQEDIWFERLDRYHENTFQIVCLKEYKEGKKDK